jgi:hypothetical protein
MYIVNKRLILVLLIMPLCIPVHSLSCSELATDVYHDLKPLLEKKLAEYDVVRQVLKNSESYKVQILYTQIDRTNSNKVDFTHYQFGLDESRYFYPASTVKLPVSILALQWLNQQSQSGVSMDTIMLTDSSRSAQTEALTDDTAEKKLPSIAHYIKKILLVSDNDAYNRLYELLGQDYINKQFKEKALSNTVINHRLSVPLPEPEQRHYNPVRFIDNKKQLLLSVPARSNQQRYINEPGPMLGKAHIADGVLVARPMDFTEKNRFSIVDFSGVLKRIFFPASFSPEHQFQISEQQRQFVIRYMGLAPSASRYPSYDINLYPDNYAKFLLVGGEAQQIPENLRIFNKTGWAYGHAIDGAYIVDMKNNIEFLLVAVVYANENDTLNDDNYQLEEIAKPFMRQLGELIYQHELQRPREVIPDLSHFGNLTEELHEF